MGGTTISRVAALYRAVCSDLMRCRGARYTPELDEYLNGLTARAHNALYGARPFRLPALARLLGRDFPRTLRRRWRFFAISLALFTIPWAVGLAGALHATAFAYEVLPASMLEQMAQSYSEGFSEGRDVGVGAGMAGFYVYNNIGIAFRCFATGILFGVGSVFFLVYNGLVIGTVTGYVMAQGYGANILTFMCGHAPFEITAIWISGAAGLQMGYALVRTEGQTRLGSLRQQAPELVQLVLGAAAMLAVAAAVEAFWSPSAVPAPFKWAASAVFTLLVAAYLIFAGRSWRRRRPSPNEPGSGRSAGAGQGGPPSAAPRSTAEGFGRVP